MKPIIHISERFKKNGRPEVLSIYKNEPKQFEAVYSYMENDLITVKKFKKPTMRSLAMELMKKSHYGEIETWVVDEFAKVILFQMINY